MATNKQGKMQNLINFRMRVTLNDGRQMTGEMLAFDRHMNLVLADTEEFRKVKRKAAKSAPPAPGSAAAQAMVESEEKRTLGLTIIRGTNIVSCSVEGPPPSDPSSRLGHSAPGGAPASLQVGRGISIPAGRGGPWGGPVGLGGPVPGLGGPVPPAGSGGFPPGFGRAGPPGGLPGAAPPAFQPPAGLGGPLAGPPGGFQPPPGFQGPHGQGRGFPPPGFPGR